MRLNWTPALISAALVLPCAAVFVLVGDRECNHLTAGVEVAEPGTPRGHWCDAVQWHSHWLLVPAVGAAVATLAVLLAGRRPWLYLPAWGLGALVAALPALVLGSLRAYSLV